MVGMMANPGGLPEKPPYRYVLLPVLPVLLFLLLGGCSGGDDEVPVLRMAEQHGLAYIPTALLQAPEELLREVDADAVLEFRKGVKVEWIRVNNATAIREAMVAGRLDVGFMGIPPYLIGRDRGFAWRAVTGLSRSPLGLVTLDPDLRHMDDLLRALDDGDPVRIALPQPGSIQHILLAMSLERRYGEATLLDNGLVSMGHPDGMSALLSGAGDIDAHFTAPPFLFRELDHPDATLLISGDEAFGGPFTFIVGVVAPMVSEEDPAVGALMAALESAMAIVADLQDELRGHTSETGATDSEASRAVLEYLAEFYRTDPAQLAADLRVDDLVYETEILGLERFVQAMQRYGYIR
jgi:NitT/TauT family transport system substrate-binding protein